jgi:hypothetical protein
MRTLHIEKQTPSLWVAARTLGAPSDDASTLLRLPTFSGRVVRRVWEVERIPPLGLRDELRELPVLDDDDAAGHQFVRFVGRSCRANQRNEAGESDGDGRAHAKTLPTCPTAGQRGECASGHLAASTRNCISTWDG